MADTLRRALVFATEALSPLAELSREAERAGFDRVWTTEYRGRDAAARALHIALATDRIGVGTGIAYAFTRPALAMAALASDVQRLADGRFALGLGTGSKGVRRWYGADFEPPAQRFAAYSAELSEALAEIAPLAEVGPPPVYGAALMPVMTRTAVRTSNGVLLHPLALVRSHLHDRLLPAIAQGREQRGMDSFGAVWCITSIDADEELARERARRQLAFYFSTPSYGGVVEGTEWETVATTVREAFRASGGHADWADLAHLVPDSLVSEVALAGTPTSVAAAANRLADELQGLGFHELVFQTVGAGIEDSDVVENCRAIVDALGRSAISGR
jgi:alkanesulfonate monooxygenase SsuD/methylene tetrahydromethanopterin reductase-like flavin-dependent oxidoreductase (luciferase family)